MATMMEGQPVAQGTEVTARAARRRFTVAEKLRVLREADYCTKPGELGALPRREGLYSSHISTWRAARQCGELAGLTPRPRGPKAKPLDLVVELWGPRPDVHAPHALVFDVPVELGRVVKDTNFTSTWTWWPGTSFA